MNFQIARESHLRPNRYPHPPAVAFAPHPVPHARHTPHPPPRPARTRTASTRTTWRPCCGSSRRSTPWSAAPSSGSTSSPAPRRGSSSRRPSSARARAGGQCVRRTRVGTSRRLLSFTAKYHPHPRTAGAVLHFFVKFTNIKIKLLSY